MKISGFQKLTLLDYPEHVAATVFTAGCNMRCPFCHNALLVCDTASAEEYDEGEVLAYLGKRVGILDGVCITGGEPLLQPDIADFMKRVKEIGLDVKLDTNGTFPKKLRGLIDGGLVDYVAMDIKNSREKYLETAGGVRLDISDIEESIGILKEGKTPYEFRTTIVRELHSTADIEKIAEWISGAPRYFLQNFVDSGNLIGENLSPHDKEALEEMKKCAERHIERVELRGI